MATIEIWEKNFQTESQIQIAKRESLQKELQELEWAAAKPVHPSVETLLVPATTATPPPPSPSLSLSSHSLKRVASFANLSQAFNA